MMGIAVDPGVRTATAASTRATSRPRDVRVVRWDVSADWTTLDNADAAGDGHPGGTTGRHSGCRTRFGPDGALWVTTGDAAVADQRRRTSQSLGRQGAAHRRPSRRPTPASTRWPTIYAYGFRNPQGISFRPSDGKPFLIEHGPACNDEITPLVAGGNGGWNPVDPGNPSAYNENVPMTDFDKFPNVLAAVVVVGLPDDRPVRRHVRQRRRLG